MRICLAGTYAITNENKNIVKKSKYILESFYYIKDWQIPLIKDFDLFLLDSGAFTFMNNLKKGENVDFEAYLKRYIEFINKYDIKYFFELDIDSVVGYEEVKQLRKILEKETNKKCIPVWHKSRGLEEWKKLTKEYDYVAIGGIVTKEIKPNEHIIFKPLLEIARKNKCKVHGLGYTNLNGIKKYKFYSVDSTSWKSGNRFGSLYLFKNNELIKIDKPKNKKVATGPYYSAVEKLVFEEWVKFQTYADKNY